MAELHVEPKKKSSILPWILLGLGLIALIWFLTRNKSDDTTVADTAASTTNTAPATNTSTSSNAARADWSGVDFNAPKLNYDEIANRDINVRGNEQYAIYGIGENILFDEGKATIRTDAEANLKQIVGSIGKRYGGGEVRVYGFTDAQGSASANKELAQQRAEAVKTWLQTNGIGSDKISVNAVGESQPVATNSTEQGRQQNRRVEIVARATGNGANTQQ
jgi:outer membrane protein OmpA-like peptidoglycan-associated protein